jgi:hypothetical protein
MRISVIRTLAACGLLGFVSGAASHDPIQDPPSRSWFCGAVTKPDQVASGIAKFPVCRNAFGAPVRHHVSIHSRAGTNADPATSCTFAIQNQRTGIVHPTSGDTYTVTYTIQGVSRTQFGTF